MTTNNDDTIRDRVRGQSDDGGILGRRDEDLHSAGSSFEDDPTGGSRENTGPDDGMGPDAPDDVAGEDEPVPGIDDDVEDDR